MAARSRRRAILLAMVFAILLVATVAVAYLAPLKESKAESPNKIELTIAAGEPLRVSFFGDSMDHGLFATDPSLGFHQLMVAEWRASGPVADRAANTVGGTAGDALNNPEFPTDQQLIIVELGTNDASLGNYRTFRTQYDQLLEKILQASPDAALLCIGVWRPKNVADTYDTIIKDLCEVRGGVFRSVTDLSVNEQLKGPAGVQTFGGVSDTFHPNDRGHRMVADRMLDAVVLNRQR